MNTLDLNFNDDDGVNIPIIEIPHDVADFVTPDGRTFIQPMNLLAYMHEVLHTHVEPLAVLTRPDEADLLMDGGHIIINMIVASLESADTLFQAELAFSQPEAEDPHHV